MKSPDYEDDSDLYGTNDPNVGRVNEGEIPAVPIRSARSPRPDAQSASDGRAYPPQSDAYPRTAPANDTVRPTYRDAQPLTAKELRKKTTGKTRRRKPSVNPAIAIMAAVFVLIVAVCVIYAVGSRTTDPEHGENGTSLTDNAAVPDAQTDPVPDGFVRISVPTEQMHEGDLILVNYDYAYSFPEDTDNVSMFDCKSKTYKVSDTKVILSKAVTEKFNVLMDDFFANTACGDMMVVSGFRDFESQQRIYQDRVETQGAEMAAKYVADPGKSEHHTGLAMDLTVYLSDGSSYYVEEYPLCDWFEEHAAEYGFVLRYPEEKAEITRISYESWHYRYVGTPHSMIMTERDLCLEEYTDFIRGYVCGEKYLAWSREKGTFDSAAVTPNADAVIYFVPASEGETTEIFIPDGCEYTVSGNNVDGFVVTAYMK